MFCRIQNQDAGSRCSLALPPLNFVNFFATKDSFIRIFSWNN